MGLEAFRCLLKNNPSVTASLCHLPPYTGEAIPPSAAVASSFRRYYEEETAFF